MIEPSDKLQLTFTDWFWFLKNRLDIHKNAKSDFKKFRIISFLFQAALKNKNPDLFKNLTLKTNGRKRATCK